ncbi:MAG: acyl carrier protein [Acidobacteria bacterium]|nr:MAG: acyl carrier protein [Acidobacteriota bacterium]PYU99891.1 MAG: acyl carrier protein [Acidobacteriota bacterium]PYV35683.1 MAG: acyl carrier protein [Acidobacteriota bacterium]
MREELRRFIIDNFLFGVEDSQFSDDDSFLEKGLIDSTGVLELVAFIEEQYGIRFQDDEIIPENLDSVNKLIQFLNKKLVPAA